MMIRRLLALGAILALAACSGGQSAPSSSASASPTHYKPPEKAGGRMCVIQCKNAKEHCLQACGFEERACTNAMLSQAIKDYESYALQQFKERKKVELRPRDFERPESCEAKVCRERCETYYNGCYEKCGGKVDVAPEPCQFLCFN